MHSIVRQGKTKEGHLTGGPYHRKDRPPGFCALHTSSKTAEDVSRPNYRSILKASFLGSVSVARERVRCISEMAPKPPLPACGYIVADLALPPDTLRDLLTEAEGRAYETVFKEVGGLHDDSFREQSRVQTRSPAIGKLRVALSALTACLDSAWQPSVFSFMRSIPGGQEQEPHQDYPEDVIATASKNKATRVPASMVLALEEGTSLRVFDGCFSARNDAKARQVHIPVGYCIIFRGDLIHNGMPYSVVNHRVHCYLSYRGLKWKPDVVTSVLPKTYSCTHCDIKMVDSDSMRSHRRYCSKNSDAAENQKIRRRTDNKEGEFVCSLCGTVYHKSGSYRSHKFRGCNKKPKVK